MRGDVSRTTKRKYKKNADALNSKAAKEFVFERTLSVLQSADAETRLVELISPPRGTGYSMARMQSQHDHDETNTSGMTSAPSMMQEDTSMQQSQHSSPLPQTLSYGESLRIGSGTLSAPPPPGFSAGPEERMKRASHLVWAVPDERTSIGSEATASQSWYKQANQHTTSFANLAAVVGTGLAESMDDSTQWNSFTESNDPQHDLSLTRQSRHSLSRLIGTPGTSPDRTVGSVYRETPPNSLLKPLRRANTPEARSSLSTYKLETEQMPQSLQRVFPADDYSLATSDRTYGQSTPLDIFTHSTGPPARDIGVTVMEPCAEGRSSAPPNFLEGILSQRQPTNVHIGQRQEYELELDTQALSVEDSRPSPFPSESPTLEMSRHRWENELQPFTWDVRGTEPSRTLVILQAWGLHIPDVRSTCEAFGALDTFRSDFSDRGVIFIGYFDIRSAQYAALELEASLKRLAMSERGDSDIRVQFCVPLNSSHAQDESIIVLSETPPSVSEEYVNSVLSSCGSIRSFQRQSETKYGVSTFVAEFHNVQDGKQALLELESAQPFGPDVIVEVKARNPAKRKRGRELLGLLGSWRQVNPATRAIPPLRPPSPTGGTNGYALSLTPGITPATRTSSSSSSPLFAPPESAGAYGYGAPAVRHDLSEGSSTRPQQTTQLVVGPDGGYSYVMVNHAPYSQGGHSHHHVDHHGLRVAPPAPPPQQFVHGPYGSYLASVPSSAPPPVSPHHYHSHAQGTTVVSSPAFDGQLPPTYPGAGSFSAPYYSRFVHAPTDSSLSSGGSAQVSNVSRHVPTSSAANDRETRHLMLDIESVESGRDTRTSLMVRNIPNKYTQQMLLSEFSVNGHGPGTIDFFYLPIDFKNRCNRGYAFINFVDYRDIVPFHRQYFGQHWKVFNSDKICDITYARIQGKAGMLKRFENSALMEKDEEYKPLVFVSDGADKGNRVPFP